MDPGIDDALVDCGDALKRLRIFAGNNFRDRLEPMGAIARVDSFWRITDFKIRPWPQSRPLCKERLTDIARQSGIDSRLENDDGARSQPRPDQRTGTL